MRDARRLKNVAVLRNICDSNPVLPNETRWSGKYELLQRFYRIRDELIEASEHDDANILIDSSSSFFINVRRHCHILAEINVVAKSLQQRSRTLFECLSDVENLMVAARADKFKYGSALLSVQNAL